MKAIVLKTFGGIENFELQDVENPVAGSNDVLISIKATAFNPIDYQMRKGSTESKLLKSAILGRELSGEIIAIGNNVTNFKIGDEVAAYVGSLASNGTYAELISVPEALVAIKPKNLSYVEAAALPMVGMTALQCFKRLSILKDKTIFIAGGAGGVGTILIKLLLANGNRNIYTTTGNTQSLNHLISLGLSEGNIINYRDDNWVTALKSKIQDAGFEYIVDLVGGSISEVCADLITVYGTYVDVTFLSTEKARETLFDKATTNINVANYAHALYGSGNSIKYYGDALAELFDKIDGGIITPSPINVVGNLSVETVQEGHRLMEENLTKGQKLVMVVEAKKNRNTFQHCGFGYIDVYGSVRN